MSVRPAKNQIGLGIRPVWSKSSLSAWRNLGSLATQWVHSEDWSDWADEQADLSLRWAQSLFVGFVMSRLIWRMRDFGDVIFAFLRHSLVISRDMGHLWLFFGNFRDIWKILMGYCTKWLKGYGIVFCLPHRQFEINLAKWSFLLSRIMILLMPLDQYPSHAISGQGDEAKTE